MNGYEISESRRTGTRNSRLHPETDPDLDLDPGSIFHF